MRGTEARSARHTRSGGFCHIAVSLAIVALVTTASADERAPSEQLLLSVCSEEELNTLVFALCRMASDEELTVLQRMSDRSVSLAAAWEHTRRSLVSAYERGQPLDEHLESFVRLATSRLGNDIPRFWIDGIKSAEVTDQKLVTFVKPVGGELYHDIRLHVTVDGNALEICASISPSNAAIVVRDQGLAIEMDGQLRPMSRQLVDRLRHGPTRLVVLPSKEGFFAALHGDLWYPYNLVRSVSEGHDLPWRSRVLAGGSEVTAQGTGFYHSVALVEQDQELFVFGVAYHATYVEGFRKSDGACTLRFGTFWGVLPPRLDTSQRKPNTPPEQGPTG